jgi:hypothetical protein
MVGQSIIRAVFLYNQIEIYKTIMEVARLYKMMKLYTPKIKVINK